MAASRATMASRVEDPQSLDYFPSPPWWGRALGEALARLELPLALPGWPCAVEEPAAGEGHLAHGLADVFDDVMASDVFAYPAGPTSADYSTIINDRHFARLHGLLEDAHTKGAQVLEVGAYPQGAAAHPLGKLNIRARPLKRKAASSSSQAGSGTLYADDPYEPGDDGDAGDDGLGGEGAGGTEGGGGGTNDSDGGSASSGGGIGGQSKTVGSMSLKNVRAVILGEAKRRIAFTADAAGLLRVELEDSGADTNRLLRCTSTSLGTIEDGRITGVPATVGARVVLDVQLEREFAGTIRVRANAV